MKTVNPLSGNFTFRTLLRFAFPTLVMAEFNALYSMADGVFVARLVNTDALAAINVFYPAIGLIFALAVMLATGGSAIVAKKMGEDRYPEARRNFTLITVVVILLGIVVAVLGSFFIYPLLIALGADATTYSYCYDYASAIFPFVPFALMQTLFLYFFIASGRPTLGLILSVMGGVINITLDYVFIARLGMGIRGAGIATGLGFTLPSLIGAAYFLLNRKGTLFFTKPDLDLSMLLKSSINGSSEMVTNLSAALITFLFNKLMLKYAGADGVAAITIMLYAEYVLLALYFGYSSGVAPVMSYNYGSRNTEQLKRIVKYSVRFLFGASLVLFTAAHFLAAPIVGIFASGNQNVFDIAVNGFHLFVFSFLTLWINVYASALFTALSNGKISALISFVRTFGFAVLFLLILPKFWGLNGVWLALPLAELCAAFISIYLVYRYRKAYNYF